MDEPRGLSEAQARERLQRDGPNELRITHNASVWHALQALGREPLFMLLFAAAAVYLWLGERSEALALLASAAVAAAINVFQKYRTERVLVALRDLSAPRALVLREGQARRVAAREVVQDDVVLLREGDRIPADATVHDAHDLRVDESLLTGESAAVHKFTGAKVFANTLVTAGQARATVSATGARTEFGLIGASLVQLHDARTPLQRDTTQLAKVFGAGGVAVSLLLALGYGVLKDEWVEGVLRGLTLAMAVLPEEFPLVITVFMALGAWRLAQQHVLTRRPGAIEALGAASVLCVDKTGTLTLNRMSLAQALPLGEATPAALARCAALACEPQPFDPMEQATLHWAAAQGVALPPAARLQRRYALREDRLVMGQAWGQDDGGWHLAAKGAPEHVLALCRTAPAQAAAVLAQVQALAAEGLRLLAVAQGHGRGAPPPDLADAPLQLLGLIGFADPLREEVPAAVAECRRAGIRILMITGDYPQTAGAIARAAGIAAQPRVVTGEELQAWDDAALAAALRDIDVVARAKPLAKLRLVQALQGAGEVVAMTGDGVNDAPALRAAHIGVAMGARGSDVAREAASLVLLRDDFGSLVAAVRQGRHIFANLRQALLYVLAVHVPIIGVSLLPLLLGAPPILLPLHVMFLEFVIDPACSLAFEAERASRDPMAGPPRPATEHVLGRWHVLAAMTQGAIALGAALGTYALATLAGAGADAVRSAVMTTIVAMNLVLILHDRTSEAGVRAHLRLSNTTLWVLIGLTVAAWSAVLSLPPLRALFRLAPPDWATAQWVLWAVVPAAVALQLAGRVSRRHEGRRAAPLPR